MGEQGLKYEGGGGVGREKTHKHLKSTHHKKPPPPTSTSCFSSFLWSAVSCAPLTGVIQSFSSATVAMIMPAKIDVEKEKDRAEKLLLGQRERLKVLMMEIKIAIKNGQVAVARTKNAEITILQAKIRETEKLVASANVVVTEKAAVQETKEVNAIAKKLTAAAQRVQKDTDAETTESGANAAIEDLQDIAAELQPVTPIDQFEAFDEATAADTDDLAALAQKFGVEVEGMSTARGRSEVPEDITMHVSSTLENLPEIPLAASGSAHRGDFSAGANAVADPAYAKRVADKQRQKQEKKREAAATAT